MRGRTNAEAAADSVYRSALFTAITSELLCCITSTQYVFAAVRTNLSKRVNSSMKRGKGKGGNSHQPYSVKEEQDYRQPQPELPSDLVQHPP
jgi:hypothetical protein